MRKRFFILILFLTTIIQLMPKSICDEMDDEIVDVKNEIAVSSSTSSSEPKIPETNSRACVVINRSSNTVLYGKNENTKRKMASTTKIMTAIIVLEKGNLENLVTVSKKAAGTGGSRLGLKANDKINVHDLLYGLMLCSGNDAAVCLAEYMSGSVTEFADLMNQKAKELNLSNTHFVTPHGLDSEEHYTTAYELALLANYALNNSKFKEIVGTKNYTVTINGNPKMLSNTNELLGYLDGVYGIKTGFTNGANRCLVTACKRGEMDIICVVLGADTKKYRTQDSIKLIEYTFQTFEYVDIGTLIEKEFKKWKEENQKEFIISKGIASSPEITYSPLENAVLPVPKNEIPSLEVSIEANLFLSAPVENGTLIGNIKVSSNHQEIITTPILISSSIEKKSSFYYLFDILKHYPSYLTELLFD